MPTYIVRVTTVSRPEGVLSKVVTESSVFSDYAKAKAKYDSLEVTAGPGETPERALEIIPDELYNKEAPKG